MPACQWQGPKQIRPDEMSGREHQLALKYKSELLICSLLMF
jgi:hypothetical protein